MQNTRLFFLFQLLQSKQISVEEREELLNLLANSENEKEVTELMRDAWDEFESEKRVFDESESRFILKKVFDADPPKQEYNTFRRISWRRIFSAAAVFLVILSISILLIKNRISQKDLEHKVALSAKKSKNDVLPGGNKAVLTLADGTKIDLDGSSTGKITSRSGINITKTADGQLVYTLGNSDSKQVTGKEFVPEMNIISTPKGGQYQINLPDGSKVWLNAASKLKFPTVFVGNEREVELTGEAYFEIRSQLQNHIKQSFKVRSYLEGGRSQEVEVLGTHFNINAYGNEQTTKTTLLEGSVKVTNLNSKNIDILEPGQQAVLSITGNKISRVDTEVIMAWKNGNFLFNNLPLSEIMKQLERWYDVEVDYAHIPNLRYHGFISKNVSLSQVIDMLELTGSFQFKIEDIPGTTGKRIRISKQITNN